MLEMLFMLIAAHALCDYPLQGEFLARGKNRLNPIPGIPFWQPLTAHAMIHGGAVSLITGTWWLGAAEAVLHWFIDDAKCRGWIQFNTDQALHILCKIMWVALLCFV